MRVGPKGDSRDETSVYYLAYSAAVGELGRGSAFYSRAKAGDSATNIGAQRGPAYRRDGTWKSEYDATAYNDWAADADHNESGRAGHSGHSARTDAEYDSTKRNGTCDGWEFAGRYAE
jgi:hypothetical protein